MNQKQRDIQRKLRILKHAEEIGRVTKTCRYFGIGRAIDNGDAERTQMKHCPHDNMASRLGLAVE